MSTIIPAASGFTSIQGYGSSTDLALYFCPVIAWQFDYEDNGYDEDDTIIGKPLTPNDHGRVFAEGPPYERLLWPGCAHADSNWTQDAIDFFKEREAQKAGRS